MRSAAAAGRFYPSSERALKKELERCFTAGPRRSKPIKASSLLGIVSPHAGYTYSGPTAAYAYLAMADGGLPETIIFIGPNHTGMGAPVGMSDQDWKTPLGVMELDSELAGSIEVSIDRSSHSREHSIEVQLPFVQFFDGDVKQVCISMMDQSLRTSIDIGKKVAKAVSSSKKEVGLVASSDFTHCGWAYGFPVPPSMTPGDFARSLDLPVIDELKKFDLEGAFRIKEELGTTACGLGPIAAVIQASLELGASSIETLDYTTSYDVDPADLAVGYASMSIQ